MVAAKITCQIHEPTRLKRPSKDTNYLLWYHYDFTSCFRFTPNFQYHWEAKSHIITTPYPRGVLIQISSQNYCVTSSSMWCVLKFNSPKKLALPPQDLLHFHKAETPHYPSVLKLSTEIQQVTDNYTKKKNARDNPPAALCSIHIHSMCHVEQVLSNAFHTMNWTYLSVGVSFEESFQ